MPLCSCRTKPKTYRRRRYAVRRRAAPRRAAPRRAYARRSYSRRVYRKYAKRPTRISKSIRSMGTCLAREGPSERCTKKRSSVSKQIDRLQISALKSEQSGLARWNRKIDNARQGTGNSFPDLSGSKRSAYASDMDMNSDSIAFNK